MTQAPALRTHAPPRVVREQRLDGELPFLVHPEWYADYPWLAQGITGRRDGESFDMSWFGPTPAATIQGRWAALRRISRVQHAVHARQVHGGRVLRHEVGHDGVVIADAADGHATARAGVLMTVSVADCVPVFVVEPRARVAALLHAGWRGIAAGVLDNGLAVLRGDLSCDPAHLQVHFGPAICGNCYEVGPEVHHALGSRNDERGPIDLRALLAHRAQDLGIATALMTSSAYCTRCDGALFHSHRAGARERQVAVLGVRGPEAG